MTYGVGSVAPRCLAPWPAPTPALPGGILVALLALYATAPFDLAGGVAPAGSTGFLLALLTIMVSAGAAVLAGVCAWLAPSPTTSWSAVLLGGYGTVVLPMTTGLLLSSPTPQPDARPAPAALRLLGVLAVAVAVLVLARRTLHADRQRRGELARRLAAADERRRRACERAAHRDHEIRNGLSGLRGISELVRVSSALRERERLRVAVECELTRLHTLLGAEPATGGRRAGPGLR